MADLMRAAVTRAPGVLELVDVPVPVPPAGHALVAVEAVGLCGSDLGLFDGTHPYARFPTVQGHEVVGAVRTLPAGYRGPLAVGDRVAVEPTVPDGTCFACRRGRYNCCARLQVLGVHLPGALADLVAVRSDALFAVGDLATRAAVLCEPASIALQAVARAQVAAGDTVLVLGAGPIGLMVALAALDRGARVMTADRDVERLAAARHLGVHVAADTADGDLAEQVAAFTDGDGAAVVVDAAGSPALLRTGFDLVAHSGTVVVVGISTAELSVPLVSYSRKELQVLGSRNCGGLFADAVAVVRRHRDALAAVVTHEFGLDRVREAFEVATTRTGAVGKVVVRLPGDR